MKRKDAESRSGVGRVLLDPGFKKEYPLLWDYLTDDKWDDGSARELASLSVFPESGVFKVMLRDRATGRCLWLATDRLSDLWNLVEKSLRDPSQEWRLDRSTSPTAKRVGPNGQQLDNGKGRR